VQNNFPLPELRYDDRDAIPKLLTSSNRRKRSHRCFYGIVHDEDEELEVVIGSLRTTKLTLDPDEF